MNLMHENEKRGGQSAWSDSDQIHGVIYMYHPGLSPLAISNHEILELGPALPCPIFTSSAIACLSRAFKARVVPLSLLIVRS